MSSEISTTATRHIPSVSEFVFRRVASRLITRGRLDVAFPSGRVATFGDGTGDPICFRLTDSAAVWRLALHPGLALGELITDDRLQLLSGSVYGLLDLVCGNYAHNAMPSHSWTMALRHRFLSWCRARNSFRRAQKNVAHHYDLKAELYRLFLDEDRQYSCAYFDAADTDLDRAQLSKKRHIAAKLLLTANQKVLDIGCGWGGMALYLAKCCASFVTGITLSKEQLDIARNRAKEEGLEGVAEFRLEDYRNASGNYDRIVSVGMFEHVGPADYGRFFSKVRSLLNEDGVMLLHTIGRLDGPSPTNPWLAKYIFPGSYAPSLSEVLPFIERSGLLVTDIEVLRLHYAKTLRAWRERFMANREEVARLYDARFCRMWEFYLAACEASFRYFGLVVFQIQLSRRLDIVPATRGYIGLSEDALKRAENREHLHPSEAAE